MNALIFLYIIALEIESHYKGRKKAKKKIIIEEKKMDKKNMILLNINKCFVKCKCCV